MKIAAICPTFRRPSLIPGIVKMFLDQSHEDKFLLILDDGQSFDEQWILDKGKPVGRLISCPYRMPSVWHKFNFLWKTAEAHGAEAVALMEDDDLYLPDYLSYHADVLSKWMWSSGKQVWFMEPRREPRVELAQRRFHGGWAYLINSLREVGGYREDCHDADTKLWFRMNDAFGPPIDPWANREIQYAYRWQLSGFPNAHGYGAQMHQMLAASHAPSRYNGLIQPALDAQQRSHIESITRVVSEV